MRSLIYYCNNDDVTLFDYADMKGMLNLNWVKEEMYPRRFRRVAKYSTITLRTLMCAVYPASNYGARRLKYMMNMLKIMAYDNMSHYRNRHKTKHSITYW